jgi:PAS domain S-box-containing protein
MKDLGSHPIIIIVATLASIISAGATLWGVLLFVRNRVIHPIITTIKITHRSIKMIPAIRAQVFRNGGGSMMDALDSILDRLAQMEVRERAFVQEYDKGIFYSDTNGRTLWVNRTYCRLFGITDGEVIGLGWKRLISPEAKESYISEWMSAVADKREFEFIADHVSSEGEEITCRIVAYPMVVNDNFKGHVGFVEQLADNRG